MRTGLVAAKHALALFATTLTEALAHTLLDTAIAHDGEDVLVLELALQVLWNTSATKVDRSVASVATSSPWTCSSSSPGPCGRVVYVVLRW